jgi:hypothetical protein
MSSDPRDSNGQFQQILRRAAELQGEPRAPDHREASIAEIEDMAAEASIDRARVRQAARELAHQPAPVQPRGVLDARQANLQQILARLVGHAEEAIARRPALPPGGST